MPIKAFASATGSSTSAPAGFAVSGEQIDSSTLDLCDRRTQASAASKRLNVSTTWRTQTSMCWRSLRASAVQGAGDFRPVHRRRYARHTGSAAARRTRRNGAALGAAPDGTPAFRSPFKSFPHPTAHRRGEPAARSIDGRRPGARACTARGRAWRHDAQRIDRSARTRARSRPAVTAVSATTWP